MHTSRELYHQWITGARDSVAERLGRFGEDLSRAASDAASTIDKFRKSRQPPTMVPTPRY